MSPIDRLFEQFRYSLYSILRHVIGVELLLRPLLMPSTPYHATDYILDTMGRRAQRYHRHPESIGVPKGNGKLTRPIVFIKYGSVEEDSLENQDCGTGDTSNTDSSRPLYQVQALMLLVCVSRN